MGRVERYFPIFQNQQLGRLMPYPKLFCNSVGQLPVRLDGQEIKVAIQAGVKGTIEHFQHHTADPTSSGVFEYQLRLFC